MLSTVHVRMWLREEWSAELAEKAARTYAMPWDAETYADAQQAMQVTRVLDDWFLGYGIVDHPEIPEDASTDDLYELRLNTRHELERLIRELAGVPQPSARADRTRTERDAGRYEQAHAEHISLREREEGRPA
jgi:hypothetical protein